MCRLIDYMSFHLEENILWSQSILSNKMIKKTHFGSKGSETLNSGTVV